MTVFDHKTFLQPLTARPGVYQMLDHGRQILYVGKAKNLKKRISNYFRGSAQDAKTIALVRKICDIEVIITHSETEALLLEQSLIKSLRPPYNIDFKDDKSYPYIFLSTRDKFPRLAFHRGAQKHAGKYFGPFPSAYSVRDSLNILQKVFQIRPCEDSFFKHRSRPCLQYQIKRCSGPCCGLISTDDYAEDVQHASMFLEGKNKSLIDAYANKMEAASNSLNFERAAKYRDQVAHLQRMQEQQYVMGDGGDIDIIGAVVNSAAACVLVMMVRGGRMLGNKTYFPRIKMEATASQLLSSFVPQFYLSGFLSARGGGHIPGEVIVNAPLQDKALIATALAEKSGCKIHIADHTRGKRRRWVQLATTNAEQALGSHLAGRNNLLQRFQALQMALALSEMPERLECFDISHTSGESTVASCVVFDQQGPRKSDYRRFNIEGITPRDDYAAMSQAFSRRYSRIKKGEASLPDVICIDGGKGHLSQAKKIMEDLQIEGICMIGVAKGPGRKAGEETVFVPVGKGRYDAIDLPPDNPGLHLIQHIRDESHRFAITAHRQRRGKKRTESMLEGITGVGPKRRRALLRHFGGHSRVQGASVEELAKIDGISQKVAEHIYARLHQS